MTLTVNFNSTFKTLMRLSDHPLRPWLASVAMSETKKAVDRILNTKQNPDGRHWAPWAPSTEYMRKHDGTAGQGLLHDQGTLLASFVAESTDETMSVSNEAPYARFLQDGTDHMPAREFLGWGSPSLQALELDAAIALARIK